MAWEDKRRTGGDYLHPKQRQRTLTKHHHVCHICGHPGAEEVDHIVPWAEWTGSLSVHHPSNLAPAHGNPCPT
ncbi:MAG: HNH endonuclease, partial [Mycobacteriaceae bacterium]